MNTFEERAVWLMGQLLRDFPEWKIDDAAADAGNAGQESGIQMVEEVGALHGGWGIYQWTGPRRSSFFDYAGRMHKDPNALQTGYDFHVQELKGAYASTVQVVAGATGLPDKTMVFEHEYEGAGIPDMPSRIRFAQRAKAAWLAATMPAALTPPEAPPPTQETEMNTTVPSAPVAPAAPRPMSFLDPVRNFLDMADTKIDQIVPQIDFVVQIPFFGQIVAPYVKYVDEFKSIFDAIRKQIDQLDPPA